MPPKSQSTQVSNVYQIPLATLLAAFGATPNESFVSLEVQGQNVVLETRGMPS